MILFSSKWSYTLIFQGVRKPRKSLHALRGRAVHQKPLSSSVFGDLLRCVVMSFPKAQRLKALQKLKILSAPPPWCYSRNRPISVGSDSFWNGLPLWNALEHPQWQHVSPWRTIVNWMDAGALAGTWCSIEKPSWWGTGEWCANYTVLLRAHRKWTCLKNNLWEVQFYMFKWEGKGYPCSIYVYLLSLFKS